MEKDQLIFRFIKKVRRRLCRHVWLKTMLWALFAGILAWGVFNTIALFVPFYGAVLYGLGALVLSLIVGCVVARFRYPNIRKTTLQIDAKGLKERVTTSYGLKGKTDFYSELQKKDTIDKIQRVHIRKSFPLRIKRRVYFALFAALIFAVTTAMLPAKAKELAREQYELQQEIEDKTSELEEEVEELKQKYDLTEEQQKALEELYEESRQELQRVTESDQLGKVQERFENKLQEQFIDPIENYNEAKALENSINQKAENGLTESEKQEIKDQINDLKEQEKKQNQIIDDIKKFEGKAKAENKAILCVGSLYMYGQIIDALKQLQ